VPIFKLGPDAMLLIYAVVVSIILAVLSWRRIALTRVGLTTMAVAVAFFVTMQFFELEPAPLVRQIVRASFIVVPSAVLLGVSRVSWLARHVWLLVLLGPFAFIGCYAGICEVCVYLQLI